MASVGAASAPDPSKEDALSPQLDNIKIVDSACQMREMFTAPNYYLDVIEK
jgi:hypothetical protein